MKGIGTTGLGAKPTTKAGYIAAVSARFFRRAKGALSRSEAREIGKMYATDLHWKYLGVEGDRLENRARVPGAFLAYWKDVKKTKAGWRSFVENHLAFYFWSYGPTSGKWPGETLEFVPGANGCAGGYRVKCAPDCVCSACSKRAREMRVRLEWPSGYEDTYECSLVDFIRDNIESLDGADIAALKRGEKLTFGGGAMPIVFVSVAA